MIKANCPISGTIGYWVFDSECPINFSLSSFAGVRFSVNDKLKFIGHLAPHSGELIFNDGLSSLFRLLCLVDRLARFRRHVILIVFC